MRIVVAAAQHGSLTAAARALGIGQPAVSHAVRRLERDVGFPVFRRSSRGVEPTEAGRRFLDALVPAFAAIDEALERARSPTDRDAITVSVSTSLASYWLMPRLAGFKRNHPGTDLRVITNDSDAGVGHDDADVWVPLGSLDDSHHLEASTLCSERITPVATPELAATLDTTPAGLREAPLLHLEERYRPRFSWRTWFAHHDVEGPVRAREGDLSNDYSVVLQAALAGEGVALGWLHIVNDLLETGALVPLAPPIETDRPFHVVIRSGTHRRPAVESFRDWLRSEMGASISS